MAGEIEDTVNAGAGIKELAQQFHMSLSTLGPLTREGRPALTSPDKESDAINKGTEFFNIYQEEQPYILENVFTHGEGEITQLFELNDGSLAVAEIQSVSPERYQELGEIKEELTQKWVGRERITASYAAASSQVKRLKAGETTFEELAAELKAQKSNFDGLKRNASPPPPLTVQARNIIFNAGQNKVFTAPGEDGVLLGKVTEVNLPATKNISSNLTEIKSRTAAEIHEEILELYLQQLADHFGVKINRDLLDRAYGTRTEDPEDGF